MTDIEYDILDELYFLHPFSHLQDNTTYPEKEILETLKQLLQKDWVKIYDENRKEILSLENKIFSLIFDKNYKNYYYLATKTGLKAHTSI